MEKKNMVLKIKDSLLFGMFFACAVTCIWLLFFNTEKRIGNIID
jgi:hypothetical protein